MKKIVVLFVLLICIILGSASAVFIDSSDNIANMNAVSYSTDIVYNFDEIVKWNWITNDNKLTASTSDPILMIYNVNSYVNNVEIVGIFNDDISLEVFYTENQNEDFSIEKSYKSNFAFVNGKLTIDINKSVYSLRFDLSEKVDFEASLDSITVNPKELNYDFSHIAACSAIFVVFGMGIVLLIIRRNKISEYWSIFKKFRFLLFNLITRDLKVKYRKSVLGFLWSLLNPLLMMLVITAVFQNIFRFEVDFFPIYYLSGSLVFNFMSEATGSSLNSVVDGGPLIKKTYIPKYLFPMEKCLFAFVNMLFNLVAMFIVIFILNMPLTPVALLLPIPLIYVLFFSFGLGTLLASLNVFFRDIGHLYSVIITAWIYLTPIIYPINIIPDWLMPIVKINPMYYFVDYFRNVVMYNTIPGLMDNLICIAFAVSFFAAGVLIMKLTQKKYMLHL